MTEPHDDLQEILATKPEQTPAELRARLLRQTECRLNYRRWLRRGIRGSSIAGVFVLGGLTGWLTRPDPLPVTVASQPPEFVFVPVMVPIPTPAESGSSGPQEIAQQLSGYRTELQAEQEDDPRAMAKLYKLAGDAFLGEQDYPNASRCYRMFLVRAGDAALSINPDDSWLLTSLKNAVFQEKSNVSKADS
jgi:hypothetical protein